MSLGVKVSSCDLLFFFVNFLLKYVDRKSHNRRLSYEVV